MFENLSQQPADKILALMQAFKDDPREHKIDLGVGVYRNAQGQTPVMSAIKTAEKELWDSQTTKAYTALVGDHDFTSALSMLVLGGVVPSEHLACAATPGGTGAIRQALELIKVAQPEATIWISDPTWPNHPSIIAYLGMKMAQYRYLNPTTCGVDFDGMREDLAQAKPGDVVLLHGCCHNPTGANLTQVQWQEVAELLRSKNLLPFIDIAYQGFGDGLEADAYGPRHLAKTQPELLLAASCSKNFGVYRERVGMVLAMSQDAARTPLTQGSLAHLNRQNYSFPPDHGARLVSMVLNDPTLRADWENELEEIRLGMLNLREQLAGALRQYTNSDRFDFLAQHRGMFSRLGISEDHVNQLREDHGIYMVSDSRMNIAGLNEKTVPLLAKAIAELEL